MIKFENVKVGFKNFQLGPLDILVKENTYLGIIGNNGAGKSTLINSICNLRELDSGRITINEKEVNFKDNSYKSDLGIILSNHYYIDFFTAKHYISYCAKFHGLTKDQANARFNDLSKTLNFNQHGTKISNLSSGNQMKVSLMSALVHNPKILIFDEPFVNIDIDTQEVLKKMLLNFKGNKTVIITSHNLDLVADICNDFLIMDEGKILSEISGNGLKGVSKIKSDIKDLLSKGERKLDFEWLR